MSTVDRAALTAARARAGRIRQGIHNYLETLAEIAAAYAARDWDALGYADWDSYVDEEFGASRMRLPVEHRQKAVTELRLAGMSQRAIGSALGVDQKTVSNDLRPAAGEENSSPAAVTGIDGKTYRSPTDAPEPHRYKDASGEWRPDTFEPPPTPEGCEAGAPRSGEPRKAHRKPLPDTARAAGWELNRAVEAVERITVDDRFAANAQQVATHLRHHLLRSIEALTEVLNQLPETKENGTP